MPRAPGKPTPSAVAVAVLALCAALAPAAAQPKQSHELLPRDEAGRDPALVQLRKEVLAIIAKRDATALSRYLHPALRTSFGQDQEADGRAVLAERLSPKDAGSGERWEALRKLLLLGGTFVTPTQFCAPYVYTRFPESLDAFEYVAVIADPAPLRTQPSDRAPIAARLHYDLLRRPLGAETGSGWVRVERLLDKRAGYVKASQIRSPIDYRACFEKTGASWQLTLFIAGD